MRAFDVDPRAFTGAARVDAPITEPTALSRELGDACAQRPAILFSLGSFQHRPGQIHWLIGSPLRYRPARPCLAATASPFFAAWLTCGRALTAKSAAASRVEDMSSAPTRFKVSLARVTHHGDSAKAKPFYVAIKSKKVARLAHTFLETPFPQGPKDVMPARWPVSTIPE